MPNIKVFEDRKVRVSWDAENEDWWFSLVDVVEILTDSIDPSQYLKRLRSRDKELNSYIGTNCTHVDMIGKTGKTRKVLAGTTQGVLRLVQSIPSKKAEPFKVWLAQLGSERLDEIADVILGRTPTHYNLRCGGNRNPTLSSWNGPQRTTI